MIHKNEIPILEYDDSSPEVIPPDHDWSASSAMSCTTLATWSMLPVHTIRLQEVTSS